MKPTLRLVLAGISVLTCTEVAWAQRGSAETGTGTSVELEMRNVNLHLDRSVILQIRYLSGEMVAIRSSEPVTLDDANSFETRISSAKIGISVGTLSNLLNQYVFAYPDAPLKNLLVTVDHGHIKETGTMHKGVDIPFEIDGHLDLTPDGEIRLHADRVTSARVPFKGLLHLFGEDLSKLISVKRDRGIRLEGDDILLDPSRMLPPPRITGKVTAV
jgi:hypothetical protein